MTEPSPRVLMRFRKRCAIPIPGYGRPGKPGDDWHVPPLLAQRLQREGIAKRIDAPADVRS